MAEHLWYITNRYFFPLQLVVPIFEYSCGICSLSVLLFWKKHEISHMLYCVYVWISLKIQTSTLGPINYWGIYVATGTFQKVVLQDPLCGIWQNLHQISISNSLHGTKLCAQQTYHWCNCHCWSHLRCYKYLVPKHFGWHTFVLSSYCMSWKFVYLQSQTLNIPLFHPGHSYNPFWTWVSLHTQNTPCPLCYNDIFSRVHVMKLSVQMDLAFLHGWLFWLLFYTERTSFCVHFTLFYTVALKSSGTGAISEVWHH